MGQAKNRKAEIMSLKAKSVIKPFIRRGDIVDGVVKFDTTGLEQAQIDWCLGVEKTLNDKEQQAGNKLSAVDSLAVTFYLNKRDFLGVVAGELKCPPDTLWLEYQAKFNAVAFGLRSGDFIPVLVSSECVYPNLTEEYKVEANNNWFLQMYNLGVDKLMSPDNSYPPLQADRQRSGWVVI